MTKIKLYTNDGQFVEEVTIPLFETPPVVVIWGDRVFVYDLMVNQYREQFAYVAVGVCNVLTFE